jgi:hypothetical protein
MGNRGVEGYSTLTPGVPKEALTGDTKQVPPAERELPTQVPLGKRDLLAVARL